MQESDVAERLPRQIYYFLKSTFLHFRNLKKSFLKKTNFDIGNSKGNGPETDLSLPESHVINCLFLNQYIHEVGSGTMACTIINSYHFCMLLHIGLKCARLPQMLSSNPLVRWLLLVFVTEMTI